MWIALIAVFGLVVVGLNVMLFVLLQGHQRALDVRTTTLQQRENAVTAQEAKSEQLQNEIDDLNARKVEAQRAERAARKAAQDADQVKADRDRAYKELNDARAEKIEVDLATKSVSLVEKELSNKIPELENRKEKLENDERALNNRIAHLQNEEKNAKLQSSGATNDAINSMKRLRDLTAKHKELTRKK